MEKDVLLNKRTKEALSSYISENLFEKCFLNESKVLFSKDWWYADGGQEKYWFITKNLLSDLDKEILDLIKQTKKFQVILNGDEISIRDLNTKHEFTVKSFLELYPHIARKNHKGDIKNQKIKEKYYTYFQKNNLPKLQYQFVHFFVLPAKISELDLKYMSRLGLAYSF